MNIATSPAMSSARTGKGRDDWQTPPRILKPVKRFAPIAIDAATCGSNPTGAQIIYTPECDGLGLTWDLREHGVTWCNPPYSESRKWIDKAQAEAAIGAEIIMLIAARVGTRYFAPCFEADALCFVQGRVTFLDADTGEPARDAKGKPMPAPFDSAIVYWGKRPARFRRCFEHLGPVIYPTNTRGRK